MVRFYRAKSSVVLVLAAAITLLFLAVPRPVAAEDLIPVKLVAIMTVDDQGLPLRNPYYVFYDRYAAETYVISSNGRITVFNKDYFPLVSIGPGRGIVNARGLDVDRAGNLYVCQSEGGRGARITILNAAYFLKKEILMKDITGTGIDMGQYKPTRVRVAADGRFYLLEAGTTAVLVLKADGTFDHWLRAWDELLRPASRVIPNQPPGTIRKNPDADAAIAAGDEEEARPYGAVSLSDITLDSEGRVYLLSNETSKLYAFDPREKFLFSFGEKGGADRKMSQPMGVAVDVSRQVIYVVDYMRHTVLVYDYYTGRYIFEFGGRGMAPLWFNFPDAIAVDRDGNCIVSDTFNQRVQVIDTRMRVRRPRLSKIEKSAAEPLPPVAALPAATMAMAAPAGVVAVEPVAKPPARLATPAVAPVTAKSAATPPATPLSLLAASRPAPVSRGARAIMPKKVRTPRPALRPRTLKVAAHRPPPPAAVSPAPAAPRLPGPPSGARVIDLPAALGVYGPIAVLGVIATWFVLRGK